MLVLSSSAGAQISVVLGDYSPLMARVAAQLNAAKVHGKRGHLVHCCYVVHSQFVNVCTVHQPPMTTSAR